MVQQDTDEKIEIVEEIFMKNTKNGTENAEEIFMKNMKTDLENVEEILGNYRKNFGKILSIFKVKFRENLDILEKI